MQVQMWKVEQMRDAVQKMQGELNIRIFLSDGTVFRIWYNHSDQIALYGRVVWNEQEQRERMEKAYSRQIQEALGQRDVKIRVEYRDGEKLLEWFDSESSSDAVEEAYRFVIDILKRRGPRNVSRQGHSAPDQDR